MKRFIALIMTVALALALLSGCSDGGGSGGQSGGNSSANTGGSSNSGTDEPLEVVLYNPVTSDIIDQAMYDIADKLEEYSGGSIVGKVIQAGTIGTQTEALQMIMEGEIHIAQISGEDVENQVPGATLWIGLPWLIHTDEEADERIYNNGWMREEIQKNAAEGGVHIYSPLYNGIRCFATTKPVEKFSDLQGLKIRVPAHKLNDMYMEDLGILAVSGMTPYTAMQQGTIDGVYFSEWADLVFKIEELMTHLILTHDCNACTYMTGNEAWFQSLTAEQQEIISRAVDEVSADINEQMISAVNAWLQECIDNPNITVVNPDEEFLSEMKELSKDMWAYGIENYNKETMRKVCDLYYEDIFGEPAPEF